MFSLIFTLIAIVLVTLLAVVAVYYGGVAYQNAQINALVDQLANQGAQIRGAAELYATESPGGVLATDINDLQTHNDLSAIPPNWSLNVNDPSVAYTDVTSSNPSTADAVCKAFNAKYGIMGIPSCQHLQAGVPVCCGP